MHHSQLDYPVQIEYTCTVVRQSHSWLPADRWNDIHLVHLMFGIPQVTVFK